jgi:hypothetical protein
LIAAFSWDRLFEMSQPLDYQSPLAATPRKSRVRAATLIVVGAVLAVNGVLLAVAAYDGSWGALGIAILIGPIANGLLLLVSLLCLPMVKAAAAGGSIGGYVAAAVCLPLAAVPIDFAIIGSMNLHGC